MSKSVIKRGTGGEPLLVYRSDAQAVITGVNSSGKASSSGGTYKSGKPSEEEEQGKNNWVLWGAGDNFPKEIIQLIRKSTVGRSALHLLTKVLYGQRLFTYLEQFDEATGEVTIKKVFVQEWQDILNRSNFNKVRIGLLQDYAFFGWCVPELIFNGNKEKVWSINYHKVSHCRLAPIDEKSGCIPFVYVSGNFPAAKVSECLELPVIDDLQFPSQVDSIKSNLKDFKYAFPIRWPDPLNDYYPVVYWDSARASGWLDIATSIPAYKKALFKNQMSLKYDIQIPMEYFALRYENWKSLSDDKQNELIDELYDEILECLTGAENAQKALMSFYSTGKDGKPVGQWVVKTIDDKMRNDAYLPDAAAANNEILFSMLVNPATSGQGNTGGNGSGGANNGGSNIRESLEVMRSMLKVDRDIIYSFFDFIKLCNGLDPNLKLGVEDTALATLDTGASIFTEAS
jgi:hypothetical protein